MLSACRLSSILPQYCSAVLTSREQQPNRCLDCLQRVCAGMLQQQRLGVLAHQVYALMVAPAEQMINLIGCRAEKQIFHALALDLQQLSHTILSRHA